KNVSFSIADGEVVGFLGVNGAGKSTIMNILTGCLSPTAGSAKIDGYDIVENPVEAKRRIGYLPELPPVYVDMTVIEYLSFMYDLKKVKLPKAAHLEEICRVVKIENVADRLIKNLSKGYRQRVGIAQALIGNPKVLILDEPTVGLDPRQIIEIRELITRLGENHTVILSSHILSEIQQICERVIIINKGVVIADDTYNNLTAALTGENSVNLRVLGPESEVKAQLEGVRGVEKVESAGLKENSAVEFKIIAKEGEDVRRALFERMVSRKWPIVMMKGNENSLEQLFLQLVEESAAVHEEEPAQTEEIEQPVQEGEEQ
ncbi:MAG: ATP-binding cassette domain-containing protein, partial [Clostridia bacterium]|nr:ATP-binding cassette domain-containing protein [Clostridia bacterium]